MVNVLHFIFRLMETKRNIQKLNEPPFLVRIIVSTIRRTISVLPLAFGLFTSISHVQNLGQRLATNSPTGYDHNFKYAANIIFTSKDDNQKVVSETDENGCTIGNVISASYSCDYTVYPAYQNLIITFYVTFGSFILINLILAARYSTYDLRYYVFLENMKTKCLFQVYFVIFCFLTIAAAGVALSFNQTNYENGAITDVEYSSMIQDTLIFVVVSIMMVSNYNSSAVPAMDKVVMSELDHPAFLRLPVKPTIFNMYGIVVNSESFFLELQPRLAEPDLLVEIGDKEAILRCMKKVNHALARNLTKVNIAVEA